MKKIIAISVASLFMVMSAITCGNAAAKDDANYPTNTISLYCGYSAGGGSDLICRILAEKLTAYFGQTVIVENKTGAGGWVMWTQMFQNAKPDGYSIYQINTPNFNLGAYDPANPRKYTYKDVDLLCNWVSDYNAIAIRKDEKRYTDWNSLVEYWKNNELISSASAVGILSDDATIVHRLTKYYGTKASMIQTGGAADNQTMLLNGSTDFMVGNVSEMANAHINGEYKIICVFAPERDKNLAEVPTFKELTGENMIGDSCRGFGIPKGADPKVREIILTALRECINDEAMMAKMAEIYTPVNYVENEEYQALMQDRLESALAAYDRSDELKK